MICREVHPNDAALLVGLIQEVESTSNTMLFGAGERKISEDSFKRRIESFGDDASTILVAEKEGDLIGYLMVNAGTAARNMHSAYIVIGVSERYRGQGVGQSLFAALDEWAKKKGLHRLELTVMKSNMAAISLYEKSGFEIEGIKKDSLLVDGEYIDEYYMAKLL